MHEFIWDEAAKSELASLTAFHRRIIVRAVETQLRHQPDIETRNRKPLRVALPELPDAAWELRIRGDLRVLYRIPNAGTVRVLRVILKGTATLDLALERDGEEGDEG